MTSHDQDNLGLLILQACCAKLSCQLNGMALDLGCGFRLCFSGSELCMLSAEIRSTLEGKAKFYLSVMGLCMRAFVKDLGTSKCKMTWDN